MYDEFDLIFKLLIIFQDILVMLIIFRFGWLLFAIHLNYELDWMASIENQVLYFCRFPCASTCKLLIQCGFDVNGMDMRRNTVRLFRYFIH